MSISVTGIQAYQNALAEFRKTQDNIRKASDAINKSGAAPANNFADTFRDSLATVNGMQAEKDQMITAFASGQNQNVHELMISMQKAGLAVNLTSAVRNKVLEAYKELSRLQF